MGEGNPPGGSLELANLLDRFGETIVPDLKHHYGIDLRDLFSEVNPISPRWALIHVHNLPMGSSTMAEVRGGEQFRGWDLDRYMAARQIDAIAALRYILILANMDPKKRKPPAPEPFPTPDKPAKKQKDERPGSFAFIAKQLLAKGKKRKEGGGWPEPEDKK